MRHFSITKIHRLSLGCLAELAKDPELEMGGSEKHHPCSSYCRYTELLVMSNVLHTIVSKVDPHVPFRIGPDQSQEGMSLHSV